MVTPAAAGTASAEAPPPPPAEATAKAPVEAMAVETPAETPSETKPPAAGAKIPAEAMTAAETAAVAETVTAAETKTPVETKAPAEAKPTVEMETTAEAKAPIEAKPSPETNAPADAKGPDTDPAASEPAPVLLTVLALKDAVGALMWYKKALDAKETFRYDNPDGTVFHSTLKSALGFSIGLEDFGPAHVHLSGALELGNEGKGRAGVYSYVSIPKGKGTCEGAVERMRESGAIVVEEPKDTFYGHRVAKVVDPYGVGWVFSHVVEAPKPAVIEKAAEDGKSAGVENPADGAKPVA